MAGVFDSGKQLDDQQQQQGGQQQMGQPLSQPTGQGPVGQGGQSTAVTPGSVGGGATGGSYSPAWTNIQAYLKANPTTNQAAQNLQQQTKQAADAEVNKANQTYQNYQNWSNAITQKGADQMANNWNNYLASNYRQQRGAMGYRGSNNVRGMDGFYDFANADFNNPYQTGAEVNNVRDVLSSPEAFQQYINQENDKMAGRQLTSGQRALQNQLDLSAGAYGSARDNALNTLAGMDEQIGALKGDDPTLLAAREQLKNAFYQNNRTKDYWNGVWSNKKDYDAETREALPVPKPVEEEKVKAPTPTRRKDPTEGMTDRQQDHYWREKKQEADRKKYALKGR